MFTFGRIGGTERDPESTTEFYIAANNTTTDQQITISTYAAGMQFDAPGRAVIV